MLNWSFVGFATVAAVSLVTMDYYQKSAKAGVGFGELGVTAYVGSFADQYAEFQTAKERDKQLEALAEQQKLGARRFLPQDPDGWRRRAYYDGNNSTLEPEPREISADEKQLIADVQATSSAKLLGLQVATDANRFDHRERNGWVYERYGATIYVGAVFKQPTSTRGVSGRAMAVATHHLSGMSVHDGFAIIQGVPFTRVSKKTYGEEKDETFDTYRAFIGLGQEVRITVVADADEEDVRDLLEHIDFAGMNTLLANPWPEIGPDAPEYSPRMQIVLSEDAMQTRRDFLSDQSDKMMSDLTNRSPLKLALQQMSTGGQVQKTAREANADAQKHTETGPSDAKGSLLNLMQDDSENAQVSEPMQTEQTEEAVQKAKITRTECKMVGGAKRCRLISE
ncbi:MAG: hypothetical protein AAF754_13320 [Pseudomonadota bacterium]